MLKIMKSVSLYFSLELNIRLIKNEDSGFLIIIADYSLYVPVGVQRTYMGFCIFCLNIEEE